MTLIADKVSTLEIQSNTIIKPNCTCNNYICAVSYHFGICLRRLCKGYQFEKESLVYRL